MPDGATPSRHDATIRVLLIDPDASRRDIITDGLSTRGFEVLPHAEAPSSLANALKGVGIVLTRLDDETAAVVATLRRLDPLAAVIVHAPRRPDAETATALGRARAHDLVVFRDRDDLDPLAERLRHAAERRARRRDVPRVAEEILGTSDKITQVRRYIDVAARSEANVLLLGESGTGKELVASAIHRHSARKDRPFVAINCSAIPENLLESELFGHEKGSFTGASGRTRGLFEQAAGGTLFFDEIGEMPAALQAKLLRVLQAPSGAPETTREYTRVGGDGTCRADVRLVFATHRDLAREVTEGRFRQDLYQRVNVLMISVPPLRERRDDVKLLANVFLLRYAALEGRQHLEFDPLVLDVLCGYDYPLNVRELESLVRSLVLLKDAGDTIVLGDLPPLLFGIAETTSRAGVPGRLQTLAEVEQEHVLRVMTHCAGNKSRAARILNISRPALDRKLDRKGGAPAGVDALPDELPTAADIPPA